MISFAWTPGLRIGISIKDEPLVKFFRLRKKENKPEPESVADEKRRQMEALISAAASIQNFDFNGQARRFLTARHGPRVRIPAHTLYYEADGMWLTALKLARELGDRKSELEILYRWGRLQHVPPSKSILFAGPVSPGELVDLVRERAARGEGDEAQADPPPIAPNPALALRFYEEAMPLAVGLGDSVKEIALGLLITRAFQEMGKQADAVRSRKELRSRLERATAGQIDMPNWLREEVEKELKAQPISFRLRDVPVSAGC
jgi:hypothetical protein